MSEIVELSRPLLSSRGEAQNLAAGLLIGAVNLLPLNLLAVPAVAGGLLQGHSRHIHIAFTLQMEQGRQRVRVSKGEGGNNSLRLAQGNGGSSTRQPVARAAG